MTNQLVFHFEDHQIQSFNINNELFLKAIQLAEILGYKNPRQALVTHVDKEDVQKLDSLTNGGKQKVLYVNESGMYALILGSKLDSAKKFKRWVTSEVLPQIRKTGNYAIQETVKQAVKKRRYTIEVHITDHLFHDEKIIFTGVTNTFNAAITHIAMNLGYKINSMHQYDEGLKRLLSN